MKVDQRFLEERAIQDCSGFDKRLLVIYVALTPVLVIHISGQPLGAVDLLAPLGVLAMLQRAPIIRLQVAFFWLFFASLVVGTSYLLVSSQFYIADTDILRVIRVLFIFIPFLLVLQMRSLSIAFMLRLIATFLWSGSIACLIALAFFYFNVQVRENQQLNWSDGGGSTLRAGGLLGNSADVGHMAAMLGIAAIGYRLLNPAAGRMYIVPLAISIQTAYVSSSRAAILQLLIAGAILSPPLLRKYRVIVLLALPAAAGYALIAWERIQSTVGSDAIARRFDIFNISGDSTFYSVNSRLTSWSRAWDLFGESPFTGVGYDGLRDLTGRPGDNSFVSIFTEGGVVAGSAYLLMWISIFWTISHIRDKRVRLVGLAMSSAEIAQMFTVDTHRQPTTTTIALILIACIMRVGAMKSNVPPNQSEAIVRRGSEQAIFSAPVLDQR